METAIQTKKHSTDVSERSAAIVVGIGILISFIGAVYSIGYVFGTLIVAGDVAATAKNIMNSEMLFRSAIAGILFVIIGDIIRAWAFNVILKKINKSISLLATWFMLIHDAIFGATLIVLLLILQALSGADYLTAFGNDQIPALVQFLFKAFDYGFNFGLFFFSFHLGLLGYLVLKSDYIPKIFGILLIIAFFGYFMDSFTNIVYPDYAEIVNQIFMLPNLVGEVAFCVWVFLKVGKTVEIKGELK